MRTIGLPPYDPDYCWEHWDEDGNRARQPLYRSIDGPGGLTPLYLIPEEQWPSWVTLECRAGHMFVQPISDYSTMGINPIIGR